MNNNFLICNNKTHGHRLSGQRQKGVSLVELMVAMTIGIFLLGAVGIVYVSTSRATKSGTLEAEMNEDASLALEILQQQIRLAGYSTFAADGKRNFSGIAVRGCTGDFSDTAAGFKDLACKTTGQHALAVRYEATVLNSQATTDNKPGNCGHESISAMTSAADDGKIGLVLADNRYYIANDGTNSIPTLFCKGRIGDSFGAATALIPNIQEMKIEYGVTAKPVQGESLPNQITAHVAADNSALGSTAGNWNRLLAVRICLLARSSGPVPLGDNTAADVGTYIDCAGESQSKTDRYLRRAYVTTIQLRNMRPDLPSPYKANTDPFGELTSP